jgi:hypothetical protein
MIPFRARRAGYVAHLDAAERAVLAQLAGEVAGMLRGVSGGGGDAADAADDGLAGGVPVAGRPGGARSSDADAAPWAQAAGMDAAGMDTVWSDVVAPVDPAVRRLLPDASSEADVAAEFRRFTQGELTTSKAVRLDTLARLVSGARGGLVAVARTDAEPVAGALTDLRLVLAERLGIRTDEENDAIIAELQDRGTPGSRREHGPDGRHPTSSPGAPHGPGGAAPRGRHSSGGPDVDRRPDPDRLEVDRLAVDRPEPEISDPEARRFFISVYLMAGLLSESLVELMLRDLRRRAGH